MSEENKNPFTEQVNPEGENSKSESPFAQPAHIEEKKDEIKKVKKKLSVFVILSALFISVILLVVFAVFVLAVGGPNNPVLKTFGIDPIFLKESLLFFTNISFGAITFILFLLLIIGIFRGLMAKKEEVVKKKSSLALSAFSFGMMFLTIMIWLGIFNFISAFVVNAEPPAAEIVINPTQKEILLMEAPVELTLSAESVQNAWNRKRVKIDNFTWDLNNDGDYEFKTNEVSFLQEFNQSGEHTIRLIANLVDGRQDYYEMTLQLPDAQFSYIPKSGPAPLEVNFDAGKFNDPKNPIVEYAWDFDEDGEFDEISQKSKMKYTFKRIGDYDVMLRTKTVTGAIKKYQAQVNVLGGLDAIEQFQAVVSASPALEGVAPFHVRLSAEDSASPNGDIVYYAWNFGDGSFVQEGKTVDHTFATSGEYEVLLTVKDDQGNETETTETVIVAKQKGAPVAVIKSDPQILEGSAPFTVEFDASSSLDTDENIVDYAWDWDADGVTDVQGQKSTHVFRELGEHKVKLTVTDADGNESEKEVSVNVTSAKLEATISVNPESGPVPLTVDFDASSSFSTQGKIVSYEWDFGDGTLPQLSGAQKSHRYTRVGVYEVKVKVFTDKDEVAEAKTKIYARVAPTQACYTVSRHDGQAPLSISFDSSCSIGNIVSWKWDFADTSISRERKPMHVFETAGTYEVQLEIVDAQNNVSNYSDTIVVR